MVPEKRGISPSAAAIVVVLVISLSAVGIVEIQTSSAGRETTQTVIVGASSSQSTVTVTEMSTSTVTATGSQQGGQGPSSVAVQVSVTGIALTASGFAAGIGGEVVCVSAAPTSPYLTLSNTGNGGASVTSVTIAYAGANNSFSVSSCPVGPAGSSTGTIYLEFVSAELTVAPVAGQSFSGTMTLSDGAVVPFAGTFQQPAQPSSMFAQISVTGTMLTASGFATGTGGTLACETAGSAPPYLALTNTGTASASVISVTITWAGAKNVFDASACQVGAPGSTTATTYVEFVSAMLSVAPVAGQSYSGTVALSNGGVIAFTGTFQ